MCTVGEMASTAQIAPIAQAEATGRWHKRGGKPIPWRPWSVPTDSPVWEGLPVRLFASLCMTLCIHDVDRKGGQGLSKGLVGSIGTSPDGAGFLPDVDQAEELGRIFKVGDERFARGLA